MHFERRHATIELQYLITNERLVHALQQILILGGGASGLAAAIAAAQAAPAGQVDITVLDRNPLPGKKLLATGNGRCNLDNTDIAPEHYFTADLAALRPLLAAVDAADPLGWFRALGLCTRTDEAGRIYPYSNQAADVLALLEHHLTKQSVKFKSEYTVQALQQSRGGYAVRVQSPEGVQTLHADAVICAMGGFAAPQFGTDGFGIQFAQALGCRVEPAYPCLTALQCAHPDKTLAGIRAKAAASLLDGERVVACEMGEVQFTDYGLSGICIMQLSGLLAPKHGPKKPVLELDVFPSVREAELTALFAQHSAAVDSASCADFWLGLLNAKIGRALWRAAGLPEGNAGAPDIRQMQRLAHTAKHWRFDGLTACGWRQAQTTGGGISLSELDTDFQLRGCRGLYFVGETLDCAGACGGFNLHWAFGSGLCAGRSAASAARRTTPHRKKK